MGILATAGVQGAVIWNAGKIDDAQEFNFTNMGPGGGGENVINIREFGGAQALPGSPTNAGSADNADPRDIDDDYYFAGNYVTTVGGAYTGVGAVAQNEAVMERAWTGSDPDLRFHFNMPAATLASDAITISFGITNGYHDPDGITTWDIDVSMNGVSQMVQSITAGDVNGDFTTPAFNIGAVGGAPILASDFDNYVTLTATKTAGTGNWVSLDYAQLDITPTPEPSVSLVSALALMGLTLRRRR